MRRVDDKNKANELEGARRSRLRTAWLSLALASFATPAFAWNNTGHMIAALIAFDHLSNESRTWVVQTLHLHPRFHADLEARLPRGLADATAAEQDRWYFVAAATWADDARKFDAEHEPATRDALIETYSHPSWHYINLPIYLRESDRKSVV